MLSNGGIQVNSSKTTDTIAAYLLRGQNLWKKAADDLGFALKELKPTDYIGWLESKLPTLKPASRRQYLAASKQWLSYIHISGANYGGTVNDLDEAITRCLNIKSADYSPAIKSKSRHGNTSSQKAKRIRPGEIQILAKNVNEYKGKWRLPATIWIAANILVGLRPCEWRTARLMTIDGRLNLEVTNAKNTNGRSHGEFRHLDISGLQDKDIQLIKGQLQSVSHYVNSNASWETFYGGVRRAIRCLARTNLPKQNKYPSLYSSRHQFAANAKSVGLTKVEVGALMGHATDETATMHYGKKKYGSGSFAIKASPAEIARVRVKPVMQNSYGLRTRV
ncbi:MAG TPA: hypothetical protein PL131_11310 [Methylotenera sp.]|nr:hypothetical protein [Methylotenera sp.]HPH06455.1 hypothetical protein [Methylotenera sp.]HPN00398.1 hypothetical protein [Methylotenera sp.]